MGDAEEYGDETMGGSDLTGETAARSRMLRAQAELAWNRVQRVAQRRPASPSVQLVLNAVEQLPTGTYLAGITGSMLASAWLYASGRRDASGYAGVPVPLLLGIGLLVKTLRQASRG